jgi:AMP nucleosidase
LDYVQLMETLTPSAAIDALDARYRTAVAALRASLARYVKDRTPPTAQDRSAFCYPELRVRYRPDGLPASSTRAYAKFQTPGVYATTITQPEAFRPYLLEQLTPLVEEYGATLEVGPGRQQIPYPYVLDGVDELGVGDVPPPELARHFPIPQLAEVGDEVADGLWDTGEPHPLGLFDAVRVDYSLKRLVHYTGTDWRCAQPWILFTNYHRYVDEFVRWALAQLRRDDTPYTAFAASGGVRFERGMVPENAEDRVAAAPWRRHQMPAYHLMTADGNGVSLVNIGVGPSNAKTITDHLAVLRPHCWLMIGHCGGLRHSQRIGDYVLAHAYLRQDHILDEVVPPEVPIPALAEIQTALQAAAAEVTGDRGVELKRRLRTGTVVTDDDRNWELRWSQERRLINLSRAIGIDMESGTIAAQGYRFRVPYGTLLCISDKPLHGEIKLPGAANAFYERAIGEHLRIGLVTLDYLRSDVAALHSRKLRSFDEPPFR